jgi:hypothetical protein
MSVPGLVLTQGMAPSKLAVVRVGDPLLNAHLEFVAARCRSNSVRLLCRRPTVGAAGPVGVTPP